MKKILVLATALLVLAGCASKEANPSSNNVLFTVGGNKVTQKQIFHTMKATDGGNTAIRLGQNILTESITDEDVKDLVADMLKKQKDDLKDQFIVEVKKLGFESEAEYVKENLTPYAKLRTLLETTLNEDYERVAGELIPRKVEILEIKDKDNATKAKEMLDNGATLANIAKELDEEVTHKGTEVLEFAANSKLPTQVVDFIRETNAKETSDLIETGDSTKVFYIVNMLNADVNDLKEDTVEAILESNELSQKELARIYKSKGFRVYDLGIYNSLSRTHRDYLAN